MDIFVAIILGLIGGIIVNILADDLPLRRRPRLPRYLLLRKKQAVRIPVFNDKGENISQEYVRQDDERRPLIAWLGITAFLFGKRESSDGKVKLSWRYPLTEVLTVIFMVLAAIAINQQGDSISDLQIAFWIIYMIIFSLIVVIDIEHKLILFVVIIPSSAIAIADAVLTNDPTIGDSIAGGLLGFMVFFLIYNGGFLFNYVAGMMRGEPIEEVAFGYGDVNLAMLCGFILGWRLLVFSLFITVFLGAFAAILVVLGRMFLGKRYSAFMAIPYGPFIVIGAMIMMLFGDTVGPALFGAVFG